MDISPRIEAANRHLKPYVRKTPLESSVLAEDLQVFLKLEMLQHTGSFKFRGAMHKLLCLSENDRAGGVVTASSGNHGMAVARAGRLLDTPVEVYVASDASAAKVSRIRELGASVRVVGDNCVVAEEAARAAAARDGRSYVSPYNDLDVVSGQGTIGCELDTDLDEIDAVFVSVGGGGLIAGVAAWLKSHHPAIETIGCQPANSRVMYESVRAGEVVQVPETATLSDGTAGGIEADSVTFGLCQTFVDRFALVSEEAIADAMRLLAKRENIIVEGAAAVALAAFLAEAERWRGKTAVVVLCGRNIAFDTLMRVLNGAPGPGS